MRRNKTIIDSYYILKSGKIVKNIATLILLISILQVIFIITSSFSSGRFLEALGFVFLVLQSIFGIMAIIALYALGNSLIKSVQVINTNNLNEKNN